jgi:hypothetical protein
VSAPDSMLGRWMGTRWAGARYGADDLSYRKAAQFLDGGPVEDWGCGTAYARQFFTHPYTGVDGTADFCDVVADLRIYRSHTYGILLRHVLEHNFEWRRILENALASCQRLALVIFTPFEETTRQIAWNQGVEVPDLSFRKQDLTECLPRYTEESFASRTGYNTETIFYVHCTDGSQP